MNICILLQQNKEGEPWREKEADANSSSIHLPNLEYDSEYEAEITAVNIKGISRPAKVHFSVPQGKVHRSTVLSVPLLISYWVLSFWFIRW